MLVVGALAVHGSYLLMNSFVSSGQQDRPLDFLVSKNYQPSVASYLAVRKKGLSDVKHLEPPGDRLLIHSSDR